MKKLVSISLFIFLAAVTGIFVIGFLFSRNIPAPGSLLPSGAGSITLNAQEIGKHSSQYDCWMIIDNKVYNLTSYLNQHPGGVSNMLPYCGKDGSEGFATKDRGRAQAHSSYADSLLTDYYLGDLNQMINQSQGAASSVPPTVNSAPASTSTPSAPAAGNTASVVLNAQEISKHNSTKDCWMIINNKVYNITSYIGAHPGGVSAIAPYCGRDGAQAFLGLPHSSYANSLLSAYFIGNLNQTTTPQQVQQNIQNIAQVTPSPRRNIDEEDD